MLTLLVRSDMLVGNNRDYVLSLLSELERGECNGVEVKTGPLNLLMTTTSKERIDYLHDYQFEDQSLRLGSQISTNVVMPQGHRLDAWELQSMQDALDEDLVVRLNHDLNPVDLSEILNILIQRHGLSYLIEFHGQSLSIENLCENMYESACSNHQWSLVRRMADLLDKIDTRIEDTLLEIIIHQKRLAIGRAYSDRATFSKPTSNEHIINVLKEFGGKTPAENILSQEILLHLGLLLKSEPELFENILTLRVWHFIQLLVGKISRESHLSFAEAYENLISLAPSKILGLLREVMSSFSHQLEDLHEQEKLKASGLPTVKPEPGTRVIELEEDVTDWNHWRQKKGGLIRLSTDFYKAVWQVLSRCSGLVIGDKYSLGSRIGSEITHDSTPGERSFALLIEGELNNIESPAYRQLNIELLETLIDVLEDNPQIEIDGDLTLDIIIGYAVRLAWQASHTGNYNEQREQAWHAFYELTPNESRQAFIEAIWHLLTSQQPELQAV